MDKDKSILMVFPIAPWPARANGVSIRYYPLLERLARKHEIDIFVYGELREEVPDDPLVGALRSVAIERAGTRPPKLADRMLTIMEVLSPFGRPYRFARYHRDEVLRRLRQFVAGRRYDTIVWVTHEYRQLLDRLRRDFPDARVVYDCIDSPFLHYSRDPPEGMPHLWRKFDLWKTRRWERGLLEGVDEAAYISVPDAAAAADDRTGRTQVIPNGIYLAGEEVIAASAAGPSIGFLGNMGYSQNIRASLRLHEDVFVPLRREFNDLRLLIIGRSPVPEVAALSGPDVEVTGTVESIWPHIAKVSVFVYPMVGGAGLQNKILEAMHAGKPVVTTDICVKSIGAQEGREILVGRSDEELRAHTRALLRDPAYAVELGLRGKSYVDRTFDMSSVLERFEDFIVPGDSSEGPPRPAASPEARAEGEPCITSRDPGPRSKADRG